MFDSVWGNPIAFFLTAETNTLSNGDYSYNSYARVSIQLSK